MLRRAAPWAAAAAVAATLAVTVASRWMGPDPQVAELELDGRVVVLPFTNATGDPAYDWLSTGLAEMTAATLGRTPGVRVVPGERLQRVIETRKLDTGDAIGRDRTRELALALGADLALEARFRHASARRDAADACAADFRIFDTDGVAAEGTVQGADFLEAADRLALSVARGLVRGRVPVRMTTSYSRDPFVDRLYAMGLHQLRAAGAETAAPYFEIALRSRPSFLQARVALAQSVEDGGDLQRAGELAREVLEQARGQGEQHLQVWSLRALGRLAVLEGRLADAQENTSQAYSIVLGADGAAARADLLLDLARLALTRGDAGRAEELFIETLQIRQEQHDRLGEVDALLEIASLFQNAGDLESARGLLQQARQIAVSLHDEWTEMRVLTSLGEVVCAQGGDATDCIELLRRVLTFYDQRGDKEHKLLVARRLAEMQIASGDFEGAESLFHDVVELAAELGRPEVEAAASLRLTWILLRSGYPRQARIHLDRTLALDRYLDHDRYHLQVVIGWFAYEQGNYRLAADTLVRAKRQAGDQWPLWADDYLAVFEEAELAGQRLPLPGEAGYRRRE